MARSLTKITDLTVKEVREVFELCRKMKSGEIKSKPLDGLSVACIFTKASLRTRISFEVGISELGGNALYVTDNEIKLGQRESVSDAARVLSRYVGLIMIRTFEQSDVEELAKYASVPVVNGLTDLVHPCQILGDYFTATEHLPHKEKYSIAYLGDGNNITNSWLNLASLVPIDLRIGTHSDTPPDATCMEVVKSNSESSVLLTEDPKEAVRGADVVYTDVWASMGQKHLADDKEGKLRRYQLNSTLLGEADPKAIVMHCLPAERGKEITDEVMDGPQSVVFDEAENRLHIQKAIMAFLMSQG